MSELITRSDYAQIYVGDYQDIISQKIAEGRAWQAWTEFTLGAGATKDLQFKVTRCIPHIFRREIVVEGGAIEYEVFESSTQTDGTQEFNLSNLNRIVQQNDCSFKLYTDPTNINVSEATLIEKEVQFPEDGKKGTTSFDVSGFERILKPQEDYIMRFKNPTNSTEKVFFKIFFYLWNGASPKFIKTR